MTPHDERTYAEIDISAVIHNIKIVMNGKNKKLFAVVKANSYGHYGEICDAIKDYTDVFCVATYEEALLLRQRNIISPILILGYVPVSQFFGAYVNNFWLTIYDVNDAKKIDDFCFAERIKITAQLKIDTGMCRLGIPYYDYSSIYNTLCLKNINFNGIFSHFSTADCNKNYYNSQKKRFSEVLEFCQKNGFSFDYTHIANSAACEINCDVGNAVRIGYALYGYGNEKLKPSLIWKARVISLRTVLEGQPIGYGATFTAQKTTSIATVSAGYGDGYPRIMSNRGNVLFDGRFLPIIGRICMDMFMIDATSSGIVVGDYVTLIGTSGDKKITAEDLGFGYEILCGISPRVTRYLIN